ncbi:WD domain, G-beta repeat containing protein [Babesia caballi]|uniref:Probable cytosolic iron-sulfur protein assembly protein CIAO1 homolog n=1 Tax=Babesia caballi TaxID=5871 RepID=A0AAV4LQI7_BABCB|nr:WD domain, G-beta repeat containing protein [Babesia caballi]
MEVRHLGCVKGHGERIWSVAWSPVDAVFATCSSDCSVRLWRLERRKERNASKSHLCASSDTNCCADYDIVLQADIDKYFKKTVRSVRFSSDGELLICASFDGTSTIWTRGPAATHSEDANATSSSSDTAVANVCSGKENWTCICVLEGHENEVKCAAFDCTTNFVATCGRDKTVWIHQRSLLAADDDVYDISRLPQGPLNGSIEFYCAAILTGHTQDVKSVAWSPKALLLASASYDNTVRLWGMVRQDWLCLQTLNLHTSTVWSVAFDIDGCRLVAGSADCAVSVYKSKKAKEYLNLLTEQHQQMPCTGTLLKLGPIDTAFSHEVARKAQKIRDYLIKNPLIADDWQLCHFIQSHHSRPVYSVDFNTLVLTGGGDNMVRIMSSEDSGAGVRLEVSLPLRIHTDVQLQAHNSDVNCVSWKPNDPAMIFATVGDDEYVKLWKVVGT